MDVGSLIFLVFFVLIFLGMPIGFSLACAGVVGMFILDIPIFVLPQRLNEGLSIFAFTAVPLFFLAGEIMARGAISKKLVEFASMILGRFTGGFALVTVAACMFFAGVSGSAIADTAAIGAIMIPAMIKMGYDPRFATALAATAGTIGPIIPPSVPMVIYAVTASTSIGKLFLGGVVPGMLMGIFLMIVSYFISRREHYRGIERRYSFKEYVNGFKNSILALIMPLIIVGGIISGIFTATESAGIAVIYSLVVEMFVYREIKWREIPGIFADVALITGLVMFIVAGAAVFVWVITYVELPQKLTSLVISIATNKNLVLLIVNVILFIAGMIIDTTSAIIIFTPLLLPVVKQYGITEIHFGILMMVNLTIGMCTPPFAVSLYVACSISKTKMVSILGYLVYLIPPLLVILVIVTFFPEVWMFMTKLIK